MSADGPLGGPTVPINSPSPWLVIVVLVAYRPTQGAAEVTGEIGPCSFHRLDYKTCYSNEDRAAFPHSRW